MSCNTGQIQGAYADGYVAIIKNVVGGSLWTWKGVCAGIFQEKTGEGQRGATCVKMSM